MAILERVLSDDFMLTSGGRRRRDEERIKRELDTRRRNAESSFAEDRSRAERVTKKYESLARKDTGINKFMIPARFRR